jgi:hypothetical protein
MGEFAPRRLIGAIIGPLDNQPSEIIGHKLPIAPEAAV